ncbi:hypothetical protein AB0383_20650 [Amycolatopsis sp. NPDC051373]|uniref:phage tail fiber protein n=1 Tax=Amycolatopsis sp. NPDC051373 TaxID=3155801 RepID=UPI00344DC171
MSNNLDQTLANAILTAVTGGTALSITAPVKLRLMATNGSATSNGTEITAGGGYTAGGLTTAGAWGTASGGSITNSAAAVTFTNMPAATVVGVELWDSSGTPKRIAWGTITSRTTASGDQLAFATSSLSLTLN